MRPLLAALLLASSCATIIPGISYDDDPKWDCDIVASVAVGYQVNAEPVSSTQCQAQAGPIVPGIIAPDAVADVNGLVTCIPDVRTVALKFRRMHLTMKPPRHRK